MLHLKDLFERNFPYLKGSFEKLKYKLKKFNIELIAKPLPRLKNLLNKQFDPVKQEYLYQEIIRYLISMKWGTLNIMWEGLVECLVSEKGNMSQTLHLVMQKFCF